MFELSLLKIVHVAGLSFKTCLTLDSINSVIILFYTSRYSRMLGVRQLADKPNQKTGQELGGSTVN